MSENNKKFQGKSFGKGSKSNGRKGKAGKTSQKFESKEARYDEKANRGATRASNDPSWYGADSTLMHNAANLSFNQLAGIPFNWKGSGREAYMTSANANFKNSLPGIAVMEYVPMPGMLNDWQAPFNVAIRSIYTFIRKSQSGAKNYNAADLGQYVMAYDSAVTYYAWMVRIYGMARMLIVRNRFTPAAIMRAIGVDYDNIVMNLAALKYYINSYAARLNAMKVPTTFNLFQRHMWLTSNVFTDAPLQTAQLYICTPSHLWKYNWYDEGAMHEPVRLGATGTAENEEGWNRLDNPWGYTDIVKLGEELLDVVLNSEDFNIMSGDIMKAFDNNVFSLAFIADDYAVVPTYDPEFLLQFHNATFAFVGDKGIREWTIHEDTTETTNVGALVTNANVPCGYHSSVSVDAYYGSASNAYLVTKKLIDMPLENTSPKDVAIATRFTLGGSFPEDSDGTFGNGCIINIDTYGTEIPTRLTCYRLDEGGSVTDAKNLTGDLRNQDAIDEYTKFAGAPIMPQFMYAEAGSNGAMTQYTAGNVASGLAILRAEWVGDFDNFAMCDNNTLTNIHSAALYGIYGLIK